jgi:hypothetical protein
MILSFPFEVIEETRFTTGGAMYTLILLLREPYYSKENLASLFSFYSARHPDKTERLTIKVYTDRRRIEKARRSNEGWAIPIGHAKSEESEPYDDAVFYREVGGPISSGGVNEFYIYCPDLKRRQERPRRVVLRGEDPYAERRVIESKEIKTISYVTRVCSYELVGVDPPGTYYSLEVSQIGSHTWRTILLLRNPTRAPIPPGYVKGDTGTVSIVALGWMCAVTADKGNTWEVWDAERSVEGWQCCDFSLIRSIVLQPDGTVVMKIAPNTDNSDLQTLYTRDYGKSWLAHRDR